MELIEFAKKYKYCNVPRTNEFKLFDLLPFEEEFLNNILNQKLTLVKQSRQMHVTSLYIVYVSWFLLYNTDPFQDIVVIIDKNESRVNFKLKVDAILRYHGLNIISIFRSNLISIELSNGNKLYVYPCSFDVFRGKDKINTVICDNVFTNYGINDFFTRIRTICSEKIIISSTPINNSKFIKLYDSKLKDDWCRLALHYSVNPFYTEEKVVEIKKYHNLIDWNTQMELISTPSVNKDNTVQIRIDDTLMHAVGLKLIEKDINISQYIRELIEADVK